MKVFCVHNVEWWIGSDADSVLKAVIEEYGYSDDDIGQADIYELDNDDLEKLKFAESDEDEVRTGVVRTFREQLEIELAEGGSFPRLLASEEW